MKKRPGVIIHCSYTPHDMDIGVAEIRRWHVEGRKWSDIGYHYVIRRSGMVQPGRPLSRNGAHAKGYNDRIGVCLVGGKGKDGRLAANFTRAQWAALDRLLNQLQREHGFRPEDILGHNQVSRKRCPGFDVKAYIGA